MSTSPPNPDLVHWPPPPPPRKAPPDDWPAADWYGAQFPDMSLPTRSFKYTKKLAWAGRAASKRWTAAIARERAVATLDHVDFKLAVFDKAHELYRHIKRYYRQFGSGMLPKKSDWVEMTNDCLDTALKEAYKTLHGEFPNDDLSAVTEERSTREFVRDAFEHFFVPHDTRETFRADLQIDCDNEHPPGKWDKEVALACQRIRAERDKARLPPPVLEEEMERYFPNPEDLPPHCFTKVDSDFVYGDRYMENEDDFAEYIWFNHLGRRIPAPPPEKLVPVYDRVGAAPLVPKITVIAPPSPKITDSTSSGTLSTDSLGSVPTTPHLTPLVAPMPSSSAPTSSKMPMKQRQPVKPPMKPVRHIKSVKNLR